MKSPIIKYNSKEVAYAYYLSPRYREAFHYALKEKLEERGINYSFLYSADFLNESKGDTVKIFWAKTRKLIQIKFLGKRLFWHSIFLDAKRTDLIIIQQENRILSNYILQIFAPIMGYRIGFFGHGKNFQAKNQKSIFEIWKRFWATKVHWWFTYTESCAKLVESYGFPREKITVFNNSIDLSGIYSEIEQSSAERLSNLRTNLCGGSENIAIYVGGMYAEKRLEFLAQSLDEIRAQVPDFHAIFMGGGDDANIIEDAARTRPWIHCLGPKFGIEKTEHALLGKVWLMPGLVGLAVLDSFAYGTPMVTTALAYHSPEFDYLEHGVNGVVVDQSDDPKAYADAVVAVLTGKNYRDTLIKGGREARQKYSIEEMARRFAEGVISALR